MTMIVCCMWTMAILKRIELSACHTTAVHSQPPCGTESYRPQLGHSTALLTPRRDGRNKKSNSPRRVRKTLLRDFSVVSFFSTYSPGMTPSLILTSSSSTDAPNCTKRNVVLPPFDVTTTHPTGSRTGPSASGLTFTTPTPITESACDAYDASINTTQTRTPNRTLVACGWTGTPIRAIIPLPRRKLGTNGVQDTIPSPSPIRNGGLECSVPSRGTAVGPSPYLTRSTRFLDDADIDSEVDDEDEEDEGSDEDCDVTASRCLSYESITAAEGLSAWSFEVRPGISRPHLCFSEECLGTARRMLCPVSYCQRYQTTPRGPACSRHPTCFRSPFRPKESDWCSLSTTSFVDMQNRAYYMRLMQNVVSI